MKKKPTRDPESFTLVNRHIFRRFVEWVEIVIQLASLYEMVDRDEFRTIYPIVCEELGLDPMPLDRESIERKLFTRVPEDRREEWEALERFGLGVEREDMLTLAPEYEKRKATLAGDDGTRRGKGLFGDDGKLRKKRSKPPPISLEGDPFD